MLIGLPSSGPHANGYSLIRRILDDQGGAPTAYIEELLAPTRIYVRPVLDALDGVERVKGMCHITGGGFVDNVPRMFGADLAAAVDLDAWSRPDVFAFLQQAGGIDDLEMLRTFNNGIGFVLCVAEEGVDATCAALRSAGEAAHVIGRMVAADAKAPSGHLLVSHDRAALA